MFWVSFDPWKCHHGRCLQESYYCCVLAKFLAELQFLPLSSGLPDFTLNTGLVGSLEIAILSPKKIGIESLSKTPGSSPP